MTVRAGLPTITHTIGPGSTNREAVIGKKGQLCGHAAQHTCVVHAPVLRGATMRSLSRRLFTAN